MITEKEAIKRIAQYCSRSEHSRADVYEKLKKWGIGHKAIEGMLDTLEREGFIDENRFCRSFVNDKFRLAKWGRLKIAQALYQKRIPEEIVRHHLQEIDEEAYMDTLQKLIQVKKRGVTGGNQMEVEVKLMRFAAGRGFEFSYIKRCLKDAFDGKKD